MFKFIAFKELVKSNAMILHDGIHSTTLAGEHSFAISVVCAMPGICFVNYKYLFHFYSLFDGFKENPPRGLEWQVVLLFLGSVSWGIRHIVVSDGLLANVQEVDVLGMNTKLCSWGSVLALPLVNLDIAVNGQNLTLGEILYQFDVCRV